MVHSFHYFSYLRGKICGNGSLIELLHDVKLLVQAMDISKEEYLFDGCSCSLKNFAIKYLLVLENHESERYIKAIENKVWFYPLYLAQRTTFSFCI
jgi:hypothetical protein